MKIQHQLDIFSYIVTIILAVSWALFGKKIECTGTEIYHDIVSSIENCAGVCSRLATMFLYGTNSETCTDEGCKCWCETSAGYEGTCTTKSNTNFNLYRFTGDGMLSLVYKRSTKNRKIRVYKYVSKYSNFFLNIKNFLQKRSQQQLPNQVKINSYFVHKTKVL